MHPVARQAAKSLLLPDKIAEQLYKIAVPATGNGAVWMCATLSETEWLEEYRSKQGFGIASKRAFGKAKYVPPKQLNYELPTTGAAEMAFLGRSNVGKSTLLGALVNEPKLFRRSKRPGCTTTVNFYSLKSENENFLVDMPGYGYAARSSEHMSSFSQASLSYLAHRDPAVLRHLVLLIDARRGLSIQRDDEAINALHRLQIAHSIVITKVDLVKPPELALLVADVFTKLSTNKVHSTCLPILHLVSAKSGFGIFELKDYLASYFLDHDHASAARSLRHD